MKKKVRINELARELEVKPNKILEMLPELGVEEKKTHSSSIDEDVAIIVKQRLAGNTDRFVGHSDDDDHYESDSHDSESVEMESAPEVAEPVMTRTAEARASSSDQVAVAEPPAAETPVAPPARPISAPLRPQIGRASCRERV